VQALSDMSEESRLQVLKDVAGTQVYEVRRKETLGILSDTRDKLEKIRGTISGIEGRIGELEEEQVELKEFTERDRKRRALEYWLYKTEEDKAQEAIRDLEASHSSTAAAAAAASSSSSAAAAAGDPNDAKVRAQKEATAAESALRAAEASLVRLRGDAKEAEAARASAEASLPSLTARRLKVAGAVARLEADADKDARAADEAGAELVTVRKDIAARRAELPAKIAAHAAAASAYEAAAATVASLRTRYEALLDRAGRAGQFKSKKERDAYLSAHASEARGQEATTAAREAAARKEVKAALDRAAAAEADAARSEAAGGERGREAEEAGRELEAAAEDRKRASASAHDSKRALDEAEKAFAEHKAAEDSFERSLYSHIPAAVRRGLEELRYLSDPALSGAEHIPGIHGPLYDLIKPKHPKFNVAVEAVAGPDLFNVVVNDEKVALRVLQHLQAKKAGRATLVPLARVHADSHVVYPESEDCKPLISSLTFDATYEKVVRNTFARALLCRNPAVAAAYARSHGLSCVTLDGDIANKRGALQGGFVDSSTARLASVAGMYDARGRVADARAAKERLEAAVVAADTAVTEAQSRMLLAEEKRRRLRDMATRLGQDAERKRAEAASAARAAEAAAKDAALAAGQLEGVRAKIAAWEAELKTDLTSKLSASESKDVEVLSKELEEAQKAAQAAQGVLDDAHRAKASLETQLTDNLLRREKQLQERVAKASAGAGGGAGAGKGAGAAASGAALLLAAGSASAATAAERSDELVRARRELADAEAAESEAKRALDDAAAKVAEKAGAVTRARQELDACKARVAAVTETMASATLEEEKVRVMPDDDDDGGRSGGDGARRLFPPPGHSHPFPPSLPSHPTPPPHPFAVPREAAHRHQDP
jgi:structural maintenance of chromosome 3 (chondroitin sulfate proteoglycan 6)